MSGSIPNSSRLKDSILQHTIGGHSTPQETIPPEIINPRFDDRRIKDNPDKMLLYRIRQYFKPFSTGDYQGLDDLQADGYNITDIPLALVRCPKPAWYQANKAFASLTTGTRVEAISLHGSSAPGQFAAMENVIWFKLTADPPEEMRSSLPPGIKAGDTAGMIMCSLIWWNAEGKVCKELEYGRLTWEGFDITAFDK